MRVRQTFVVINTNAMNGKKQKLLDTFPKGQRFKGAGENRKVSTSFRSLLTKRRWRLATPALLVLFS